MPLFTPGNFTVCRYGRISAKAHLQSQMALSQTSGTEKPLTIRQTSGSRGTVIKGLQSKCHLIDYTEFDYMQDTLLSFFFL